MDAGISNIITKIVTRMRSWWDSNPQPLWDLNTMPPSHTRYGSDLPADH